MSESVNRPIGMKVPVYSLSKEMNNNIHNSLYYDLKIPLSDNDLVVENEYQVACQQRGKSLDVSSEYSGDFSKIKNIHFIKGTHFDRDFFRRMYPNIKIKYKPSEADVIVYDEKSLFNNDNPPIFFKASKSYVWDQSISRALRYIYEFLSTSPGSARGSFKGKIEVDPKNSSILTEMCNIEYANSYEYIYLNKINHYFNDVANACKQFLHSSKIISSLESSQRSNHMTFSELITLFEQIISKNVDVVKVAAETLIMFNSSKYLPIQKLLLGMNAEHVLKSKKVNMFCASYSIRISQYDSIPRNFFDFYKYVHSNIISMLKNNKYDNKLLVQFLKSSNLAEYLTRPYSSQDAFPLKNLSINFEFKDDNLNDKPSNQNVDQAISEFTL